MVSMIMSLMIMPLMIMSLMRMTMIIQFLPMNVFNTFYIITDFFMIMATFLSWLVIVFVILAMIVFVVVFMIMFMVMIMWTVFVIMWTVFVIMFWLSIINWRFSFYLSSLYDNFNLMLMYWLALSLFFMAMFFILITY